MSQSQSQIQSQEKVRPTWYQRNAIMANKREDIKFDNQIQSIKKDLYRKLGNVQYGSVRVGNR